MLLESKKLVKRETISLCNWNLYVIWLMDMEIQFTTNMFLWEYVYGSAVFGIYNILRKYSIHIRTKQLINAVS